MRKLESVARWARVVVAAAALALLAGAASARAASEELASRRVPSKNLFFVRIGYGYATGPSEGGGALLGLGWRRELNRVALDVSFANVLLLSKGNDNAYSSEPINHGSFTPVAVGVNYHFRPLASGTPYAGLGFGIRIFHPEFEPANSFDVRLNCGYEMLRASTVRLFVQADAILPTYKLRRKTEGRTSDAERSWPGTFTLSLGVGFGGR